MDGQCDQAYNGPRVPRANRDLYAILHATVRLLFVPFPFLLNLPSAPSTVYSIINRYHGPMDYCSNILRTEIQQRLSLPEEERPLRSLTPLYTQKAHL